MTALYSTNLHVMGKSNVPLLDVRSLATLAEGAFTSVTGVATTLYIFDWSVAVRDAATLVAAFGATALVGSRCTCSSARTSARPCRPPATTRR
jgi:putative ABC transport system permease protein